MQHYLHQNANAALREVSSEASLNGGMDAHANFLSPSETASSWNIPRSYPATPQLRLAGQACTSAANAASFTYK